MVWEGVTVRLDKCSYQAKFITISMPQKMPTLKFSAVALKYGQSVTKSPKYYEGVKFNRLITTDEVWKKVPKKVPTDGVLSSI